MMRTAEKLSSHLEGREANLGMILIELGHDKVIEVIDVVIGKSVWRDDN